MSPTRLSNGTSFPGRTGEKTRLHKTSLMFKNLFVSLNALSQEEDVILRVLHLHCRSEVERVYGFSFFSSL
ncbi:MAG: hypothetical protein QXJ81_06040 [Metallosphaera sp.]